MINYYVSPTGRDTNDGKYDSPFLTIERALQEIKKTNAIVVDDFSVILMDGHYHLTKTLTITEKNNLRSGKTLTIKALNENKAVIEGGRRVTNWEPVRLNGCNMLNKENIIIMIFYQESSFQPCSL